MHLPLKELTNFLINTKKMSISHVAAISAIGLTTMATGYLTYTKIRLYEKTELIRIEDMHHRYKLEHDKDRLVFDKDRLAFDETRLVFDEKRFKFDQNRDQHTLTFRRSMIELDNSKLP
jgi:hypothetical protein